MNARPVLAVGLALCTSTALLADFQYEETTKITGGMLAGMTRMAGVFSKQAAQATKGTASTVMVKGNRMATMNPLSGSIVDLDRETITTIDFDKKTYSVMTFAQMKQAVEDAMAKMKQQQGKKPEGAENVDMSFKAAVKETGQTRQVAGLEARQFILTMAMEGKDQKSGQSGGMAITNDMWMAADIAGYQEVRDFHMRMAQKLGMVVGGGGMNMSQMARPEMFKGLADMAKEMSKLKGIPVLQMMRMGVSADGQPLPAASEMTPQQQQQAQGPTGGDVARGAATSAAGGIAQRRMGRLGGLAGGLGGLGGLGGKKKQEESDQPQQQEPQQGQPAGGAAGGVLLETTTELTGFSSAPVDPSKLEVPAGFKQIQSEIEKGRRR